jgi:hypothetical protein
MMRKILSVFVAGMIGAALLVILLRSIASIPNDDPGGWRSAVRKYIDYQARTTGITLEVAAAAQAALPWEFRHEMSSLSFGPGLVFQVDIPYGAYSDGKALPMPPVELWCVRLKVKGEPEGVRVRNGLVLVAKHQDLYSAEWITHLPPNEGPALSPVEGAQSLAEILATIGCQKGMLPPAAQQS